MSMIVNDREVMDEIMQNTHHLVRLGLARLLFAARGICRARVDKRKLKGLGVDRHVKAQVLFEFDRARRRIVLRRRGGEHEGERERDKESGSHGER